MNKKSGAAVFQFLFVFGVLAIFLFPTYNSFWFGSYVVVMSWGLSILMWWPATTSRAPWCVFNKKSAAAVVGLALLAIMLSVSDVLNRYVELALGLTVMFVYFWLFMLSRERIN